MLPRQEREGGTGRFNCREALVGARDGWGGTSKSYLNEKANIAPRRGAECCGSCRFAALPILGTLQCSSLSSTAGSPSAPQHLSVHLSSCSGMGT